MDAIKRFGVFLLPAFVACGCESLSHTENGALAGGALGAGAGALIGHAAGNTGAGALVGAGVGALSGGLIGHAVDKSEERTVAAASASHSLGMVDVVQMAQSRVSDDVIISEIRSTGSVFRLSAQDTVWLKQNGVSDAVVQEMLATAAYPPSGTYTTVYRPVYVVDPPPPVYVGVGYGCGYRRWR